KRAPPWLAAQPELPAGLRALKRPSVPATTITASAAATGAITRQDLRIRGGSPPLGQDEALSHRPGGGSRFASFRSSCRQRSGTANLVAPEQAAQPLSAPE